MTSDLPRETRAIRSARVVDLIRLFALAVLVGGYAGLFVATAGMGIGVRGAGEVLMVLLPLAAGITIVASVAAARQVRGFATGCGVAAWAIVLGSAPQVLMPFLGAPMALTLAASAMAAGALALVLGLSRRSGPLLSGYSLGAALALAVAAWLVRSHLQEDLALAETLPRVVATIAILALLLQVSLKPKPENGS